MGSSGKLVLARMTADCDAFGEVKGYDTAICLFCSWASGMS